MRIFVLQFLLRFAGIFYSGRCVSWLDHIRRSRESPPYLNSIDGNPRRWPKLQGHRCFVVNVASQLATRRNYSVWKRNRKIQDQGVISSASPINTLRSSGGNRQSTKRSNLLLRKYALPSHDAKISVKGALDKAPLYASLDTRHRRGLPAKIKWNFTTFLV